MNREERGVGTEGYKGEQDASLGLVVVVVVLSSRWCLVCYFRHGGFFSLGAKSCVLCAVVRVEARRTRTGGAALPALPRSMRTREESTGESSPTIAPRGCR